MLEYYFWSEIVVQLGVFGFLDRLIKWFRHSNTWGPPSLRPPFSLKAAAICLVITMHVHNTNMFSMKVSCKIIRAVFYEKQIIIYDVMLHISIETQSWQYIVVLFVLLFLTTRNVCVHYLHQYRKTKWIIVMCCI